VASISRSKKSGLYRILFNDPVDNRRQPIRLGRGTDKKFAKTVKAHVEHLVAAKLGSNEPDAETIKWVAALPPTLPLRLRLTELGLTAAPSGEAESRLKPFLDGYIALRRDLKPSTVTALGQAVGYLVEHFGADKRLRDITRGDAKEFGLFLEAKTLAAATIRRRLGMAKQFFRFAFDKHVIAENPFAGIKTANLANPARQHYIDGPTAQKVLAACPDAEWRLIFALCRYAGLRCPSEIVGLRWAEVLWGENRFLVHSPKTERHEGQATRQVPIFAELAPHLQAAFDAAEPGAEYVITRYRPSNANLSTQLRRILWRAGIDAWPRLFQNLRASCDTDLAARFPAHVCARWLGHTPAIAAKHYLQLTDADFDAAAGLTLTKATRALGYATRQATRAEAIPDSQALSGDQQVGSGAAADSNGECEIAADCLNGGRYRT